MGGAGKNAIVSRPILLVAHDPIHARQPTGPLFDIILLAHVACALVGLASVVASAVFAARLRGALGRTGPGATAGGSSQEGDVLAPLERYYAPGANWMGRVLYAVPVLGIALVATSKGYASFADGWLLGGVVLWVAAILLGEGVVWSGERQIQELLRHGLEPTLPPAGDREGQRSPWTGTTAAAASRRVMVGAVAMGAVLIAAFVVMTARP